MGLVRYGRNVTKVDVVKGEMERFESGVSGNAKGTWRSPPFLIVSYGYTTWAARTPRGEPSSPEERVVKRWHSGRNQECELTTPVGARAPRSYLILESALCRQWP